jgi:hypothetical protein
MCLITISRLRRVSHSLLRGITGLLRGVAGLLWRIAGLGVLLRRISGLGRITLLRGVPLLGRIALLWWVTLLGRVALLRGITLLWWVTLLRGIALLRRIALLLGRIALLLWWISLLLWWIALLLRWVTLGLSLWWSGLSSFLGSQLSCLLSVWFATKVVGKQANAQLGVRFALLEQVPLVFHHTFDKSRNGQSVLSQELIGNQVLVPELESELRGVFISNLELEDLVPLWASLVFSNRGLVSLVLKLDDNVGIRLADPLGIGQVASFSNTDIEATHCMC